MSASLKIPSDTRLRQQRASDPSHSVWVSANAGSGKTFVLSRRVIRLLLAGNDPATILCLTFTKAAATEMAGRVFEELGRWTRLTDEELKTALSALGESDISARKLRNARRLFASALETPGGLKVQTIHAFCERLLHTFPFEANVPGHFEVADDATSAALLHEARQTVMLRLMTQTDTALRRAYDHLIDYAGDQVIDEAIAAVLSQRHQFADALRAGEEAHDQRLANGLNLGRDANIVGLAAQLRSGATGLIDDQSLRALAETLRQYPQKTNQQTAERISAYLSMDGNTTHAVDAWLAVFLTGTGSIRKSRSLVTKAFAEENPALFLQLEAVLDHGVSDVLNRRNGLQARDNTRALMTLAASIIEHYLLVKQRRGLLDYDDLISKTRRLLADSDAAMWVQYKLDRGLNHILVDEAQDTSPEQWQVINSLSDAFFHDSGSERTAAGGTSRTIFAVGDEKQSIFSFQGAVPGVFEDQRDAYSRKASQASLTLQRINLNLSFRSTDDVLSAVDRVFEDPAVAHSISRSGVEPHQAFRAKEPGAVELWPHIQAEKNEQAQDWRAPVDAPPSTFEQLAEHIATDIARRVREGRATAGDFLILLRKRGQLMQLINRALKRAGVPVAGMDRLRLTDHIAVKDLLVLAQVLLLPDDDLALATLLKSPLFAYSDDDLLRIAPERDGSLFSALKSSGHSQDAVVVQQLMQWLSRVDFEPPHHLFARILSEDGGRAKILTRLGMEADDVLTAFLDETIAYAKRPDGMGLQGFVHWLSAREDDLKRQMDRVQDEVRIMTAHGAKGLEAGIVYLVEDGSKPVHAAHIPRIFDISDDKDPARMPTFLWNAGDRAMRTDVAQTHLEAKEQDALDEYRRLLYVAMTRAEDRLIVCGVAGVDGLSDASWYRTVETGLAPHMTEVEGTGEGEARRIWQRTPEADAPASSVEPAQENVPIELPHWIGEPPPAFDIEARPVTPSRIELESEATDEPEWSDRFAALGMKNASSALLRGTIIHELLQYLPGTPQDGRAGRMRAWLAHRNMAAEDATLTDDIVAEVTKVLNAPDLAFLFEDRARAEVAVAGVLPTLDGPISVRGTIDRLVQEQDNLLIVDFKTNRRIPDDVSDVPDAYVNQLAAYREVLKTAMPGLEINAALVWTAAARLDRISPDKLQATGRRLLEGA